MKDDKIITNYNKWLSKVNDISLVLELNEIKNNYQHIEDRFYKSLKFGTAGLRGILGAGTNRMNIHTVGATTQGYANYLKKLYNNPTVAIAYDNRKNSKLFAITAASVLAANNINVYIFNELTATPILSYAVRQLHCQGGIVVTASHNPKEYNGYKVYNDDGCQIDEKTANIILNEISLIDIFDDVKSMDYNTALNNHKIRYVDENICNEFIDKCLAFSINKDIVSKQPLTVVYTPLNGTGLKPVCKILEKLGIKNLNIVEAQKYPDENFSTCPSPNPETKEALEESISLCKSTNADILLATDPDSDRLGIAVKDRAGYTILSGNQLGVLLIDYMLNLKTKYTSLPKSPVVIKSIVSTPLADKICDNYNIKIESVLTGFKN
ncbi:MAG: phospho-sugar mutase, partial [Oscillospiraceae bacterium]